jgi:hypothetical protein
MKTFTDDEMNALLPATKEYNVVILKRGPSFTDDAAPAVIWEHGRRNFGLRDDGVLAVVLPVTDGSDVCGVGVFTGTVRSDRCAHERRSRCASRGVHLRGAPVPRFPRRLVAVIALRRDRRQRNKLRENLL